MSLVETPLMKSLARYLDVTAYRQGVVSANIANIDTPGYRTHDINFKQEMDKALQSPDAPVTPRRANGSGTAGAARRQQCESRSRGSAAGADATPVHHRRRPAALRAEAHLDGDPGG